MFDWFFEFLYGIIKTMLYCIDFIINMAGMLCGITPVTVDGRDEDITQVFLTDERVLDAFKYVLIIGFILLFIFTIYAVVRSILRNGEGKSAIQICLSAAKAMGWFLLVPAFIIIGSMLVSTVMNSVHHATSAGSSSVGASIFTVIAEEAYDGAANKEQIMEQFYSGDLDYYDTGVVDTHFDLKDINYFLGFIVPLVVLVLIALSLLAFVERLIHIVILFIISPMAVSSSVLDDGARFKLWRDQVINKFLMAYGSLIAINVFMLMIGVVNKIEFFENDFANGLAHVVFIIGGSIACYKAKSLIGNIINQGAGTQAGMESSAANGIMGGIMGATVGRAAGIAASVMGFPMKKAGMAAASGIKERITRNHNARTAVKAEAARNKYSEKVLNSNSFRHQSTKAGLLSQADIKKTLYGEGTSHGMSRNTIIQGSGHAPQTYPSHSNDSQGYTDDTTNKQAAETVRSSLQSSSSSKAKDVSLKKK